MKSRWDDAEAVRYVKSMPNVSEPLALRTYSARLLGADPSLVLHGGGNTSVKTRMTTLLGDTVDVLHIKGSGWDLATIEPPGHPAVRMTTCMKLLELPTMTDEQMVNELRLALLDASAPTPSVEALLHAALPATFIDHTHADALLAVTDQEQSRRICEELFGNELLYIPYVMPGFGLARACKIAWDKAGPGKTVMVLERHGIFTFGDTAKESYERMISAVSKCEKIVQAKPAATIQSSASTSVLPTLRGSLFDGAIVALRSSDRILDFLARPNLADLVQRGCATPDHVIRTKPWPVLIQNNVPEAIAEFGKRYDRYFEGTVANKGIKRTKLDNFPRIALIPSLGICGIGATKKEAEIAADVYEHTIDVITAAESIGAYRPLGLDDLFDVEYWSLEQAKLKKAAKAPLGGLIALVTGAASGIGRATAELFVELGAHVVMTDRDAIEIKKHPQIVTARCDVTSMKDVNQAFDVAVRTFGGVDIVVSNAGIAAEGKVETEAGEAALKRSLEINLLSHVNITKAAVEIMRLQKRGGTLLFNASKSAFNQGRGFGPYAIPKAALVSLMKQYAVDLAADGIRSNAVNADRIRTNIFGAPAPGAPSLLETRAKARGITVDEYFKDNLLGREVTARDVAEAFAWLATAKATTGCVVTVDGGNAAAFPR